ncbi:hypothetical protein PG993_011737 [Apiospora rasikravindrae]|uniref:Uncharacterized protein n=1 Tax=Apiospora rasikravindrae TaxID=990691 RepID=A0ABR1S0G4_9PEZI
MSKSNPPNVSCNLPDGFLGNPFAYAPSSIEEALLSTRRHMATQFSLSRAQANLIVIFQALHRTQQHRLLTHRVEEDVAAVLAFNRQNKEADKYHFRKHLHVLVDEEIRWRLMCGQHAQQVTPFITQGEAKKRYVGEMKQLIRNSFKYLMEVRLPDLNNPAASPRNDHFGKLKDVDLSTQMLPMQAMNPPIRYEDIPKPKPKELGITAWLKDFEAKKAAESSKKAAEEAAKESAPDNGHEDSDDGAGPSRRSASPPTSGNRPHTAGDNSPSSTSMDTSDDSGDYQMAGVMIPLPASDIDDEEPYTEEQIAAAEHQRAAEEALAEERRKAQEKIEVLEAEVAGYKKAMETLTRGFNEMKVERDHLAAQNPKFRESEKMARNQARAAHALAAQREEDLRAATDLVSQHEAEARVAVDLASQNEAEARAAQHAASQLEEENRTLREGIAMVDRELRTTTLLAEQHEREARAANRLAAQRVEENRVLREQTRILRDESRVLRDESRVHEDNSDHLQRTNEGLLALVNERDCEIMDFYGIPGDRRRGLGPVIQELRQELETKTEENGRLAERNEGLANELEVMERAHKDTLLRVEALEAR